MARKSSSCFYALATRRWAWLSPTKDGLYLVLWLVGLAPTLLWFDDYKLEAPPLLLLIMLGSPIIEEPTWPWGDYGVVSNFDGVNLLLVFAACKLLTSVESAATDTAAPLQQFFARGVVASPSIRLPFFLKTSATWSTLACLFVDDCFELFYKLCGGGNSSAPP